MPRAIAVRSAATHWAARRSRCWATTPRASTGARRTRHTSSAMLSCAASTITRPRCRSQPPARAGTMHAAIWLDDRELRRAAARMLRRQRSGRARALLARPRDVRLTIDARLQWTMSSLLEKYAARSSIGHAAAIVVDPHTGNARRRSYRFRRSRASRLAHGWITTCCWIVRATACTLQARPSSRPRGALDKGLNPTTRPWPLRYCGRPRRRAHRCGVAPYGDDAHTHPHGTLRMHDGLVHARRAYFAQLAVQVGAKALMDTANKLGISTASASSMRRLRENTQVSGRRRRRHAAPGCPGRGSHRGRRESA